MSTVTAIAEAGKKSREISTYYTNSRSIRNKNLLQGKASVGNFPTLKAIITVLDVGKSKEILRYIALTVETLEIGICYRVEASTEIFPMLSLTSFL